MVNGNVVTQPKHSGVQPHIPAQSDMRQLCFGALGLVLRKIRKAMRSSLTVPATQA